MKYCSLKGLPSPYPPHPITHPHPGSCYHGKVSPGYCNEGVSPPLWAKGCDSTVPLQHLAQVTLHTEGKREEEMALSFKLT